MAIRNQNSSGRFVVATPGRSVCDDHARVLAKHQALRYLCLGTRRGVDGVPPENTRLNPSIGLVAYAAARSLSVYQAEALRFRLHPWFDHWVKKELIPGDHIISSYGYANASFQRVRQTGGKTFLDGGNSHPENFWSILQEEHARWKCSYPPVARHHYLRSLRMMEHVDYVLSPSTFVTRSFLERGFKAEQIVKNIYALDLSLFKPPAEKVRPKRPFTVIAPGSLSLRKGTPYLLQAFQLVVKKVPDARLVLNQLVTDNVAEVFRNFADLPIDWKPPLAHPDLAETMRNCDLLVLPSLEDGFARTVTEGLACGLPVITTRNTGASDLIMPGSNGEIVPIRDPSALAEAMLRWHEKIMASQQRIPITFDPAVVSTATFERDFLTQLRKIGVISG